MCVHTLICKSICNVWLVDMDLCCISPFNFILNSTFSLDGHHYHSQRIAKWADLRDIRSPQNHAAGIAAKKLPWRQKVNQITTNAKKQLDSPVSLQMKKLHFIWSPQDPPSSIARSLFSQSDMSIHMPQINIPPLTSPYSHRYLYIWYFQVHSD